MTCWKISGGGALARLADRLGRVYRLEQSRPVARKYLYLDDFNHHIFHAGAVLYRRGRHWELLIDGDRQTLAATARPVFAGDLELSAFRAALERLIGLRMLEPVAEVRFADRCLTCREQDKKVVLRVATGELESCLLLELRPLRGYRAHADRLEAMLRDMGAEPVPGGLPRVLLCESGFEPRFYSTRPELQLLPDMPAIEAVTAIATASLEVARSNEAGIVRCPEDTEFLHDYRVALRRVRSLLSLLREVYPAPFADAVRRRLRALARKTGRLRDLDVYLLERPRYMAMLSAEFRPGLEGMFADFSRRQRAARRSLRSWLASAAYQGEISGLAAAFTDRAALGNTAAGRRGIGELVTGKLARRYRKVRKLGRRVDRNSSEADLHRLRIECKKLRYMLEFFGGLYDPAGVAALVKRLRSLQDNLGRLNDCALQQSALRDYLRAAPDDKRLASAIDALLLALEQQKRQEWARLEANISNFIGDAVQQQAKRLFGSAGPEK